MLSAPDPDLSSDYAIPAERIREFREKGHTCLRGLASREEVAAYGPAIEAAAHAHKLEKRALAERDTYGQAFLQIVNLWLHSRAVQAFVFSRRFARAAAQLLGVPVVRLYHDQALFKEPGGGFTPWHQDQFYWPLASDATITLWMPLVDVPPEVGTMRFASGSHRLGHLGEYRIGDESQVVLDRVLAEKGLAIETHGALAAGDATFHAGWTVHGAGPNPTPLMRSVMTVIYFADGTRVAALDHPNRAFDAAMYLPGCRPGELARSALTPRLYPPEFERMPDPPREACDTLAWIAQAARAARAVGTSSTAS
jgi:ectoine hydroxylase-related dioxygenase (phytanoyl-CoA dioxygenase family)